MNEILLGIDPGKRTGICWIAAGERWVDLDNHFDVPDGVEGVLRWWDENLASVKSSSFTIVMEDFTNREGTFGIDHTPERVIGAIQALAAQRNIPVVMRPPSGRLKQVPDAILKALKVYLAGKGNRNAKEAVRHCVAFLKAHKHPVILAAFDKGE